MAGKNQDAEATAPEDGEKPAKKGLPIKLIAIAGGAVLLLGGGGFAAWTMLAGGGDHAEQAQAAPAAKPAVFFDVPDVLVNLSGANNERTQYLKVKVVLELSDAKLKEQLTPLMPRLMDMFQTYLRELRPTDLDGSAGLYRLKEELTRRVNASIAPNRVNAVLFKEIVVQ
ncbi:flagellar basal body-associated protein FliL [Rhodoplanes sp. TEM]|uniref:Flagellar protein FliL n=1 Tax=Rhodoplanes tepidamans TaxID=200616 RepID=A0ABT5J7E3_RHOTP|nr:MULTISPECIES: flagellar basal body-associated protein FliL [Rhodoplanes]MDC7785547.1 flagellar basal body-associated protein FliL [Rhodoplanes tepidamans]MDC7986171.1 flagellar basal body-associated protein FliL [Rhodoplanes sp. TEM]MDQ0353283.1 flagellar FliL protein [Rhodoplanes tepidamans]